LAFILGQVRRGHRRSSFTLEVYTDVKSRRDAANARLGALLAGEKKAQNGANGALAAPAAPTEAEAEEPFPA
jgi:hypothetical protein